MLRVEEYPCRIALRVDELQHAAITKAARAAGVSRSQWARDVLDAACRDAESAGSGNPFIAAHKRRQNGS